MKLTRCRLWHGLKLLAEELFPLFAWEDDNIVWRRNWRGLCCSPHDLEELIGAWHFHDAGNLDVNRRLPKPLDCDGVAWTGVEIGCRLLRQKRTAVTPRE
jgi:hypothetical protein